jgi:hypothetical protein
MSKCNLLYFQQSLPHKHFFLQPTQVNFKATSLNPFASNRLIILPTNPLCTPSGLTMIKVRSLASAIALENKEKNANTEQITIRRLRLHRRAMFGKGTNM